MKLKRSNKYFLCPFFKWDGDTGVSCEGGKPEFPDEEVANDYQNDYCAGDWEECTLSKSLMKYWEKRNAEEEKVNKKTVRK